MTKKGNTKICQQEFVVRNDSSCGSTIGPMLSAKLGLRTVGKLILSNKWYDINLHDVRYW